MRASNTILTNQDRDTIKENIVSFREHLKTYDSWLADYFSDVESIVDVTPNSITPQNYKTAAILYTRVVNMLLYVKQLDFPDFLEDLAKLRDYVNDCIISFRYGCKSILGEL